ncbi:tetratricopeptide repeat protein [Streptomyces sp. NPDC002685]|uniref:tetratricopeptide repeat protein n=1 Tax=Streptomyces sp. NPDC002685 TaxID=3154540 RepID=UPI00331DD723
MSRLPWPRRRGKPATTTAGAASMDAQAPSGVSTVTAGAGAIAVGGGIKGAALGDNSQVTYIEHQYVTNSSVPVQWPVLVGTVPVPASAFQPRAGLRAEVDRARGLGESVVLASEPDEPSPEQHPGTEERTQVQVMSGGGGVGKSQLAAAYARDALHDGTDVVVWTSASDVQQVVTAYAEAALHVQVPGHTGTDPERDARTFLNWLAATDRRWLVVLDDITEPDAIDAWWPDSLRGSGWTLATTRLKDPLLTGGGRARIDVDVYHPAEATTYLTTRLTHGRKAHLVDDQIGALGQALGYLPLALGHAAAYMLREDVPCRLYLERFTDRAAHLDELLPRWADTERYGRQITTTLLLALDATDQASHGPLARAALRITAVLDPAGHPAELWSAPALLTHLTEHRLAPPPRRSLAFLRRTRRPRPVSGDEARAALSLLDRYGLITYDSSGSGFRAVRIHALTARAVRETTPQGRQPSIATSAADALLQIWPVPDQVQRELAGALRANVDSLTTQTGDLLWTKAAHLVLYRAGASLVAAGLHTTALVYWERMVADCERFLGRNHPATVTTRGSLAAPYWQVGRTAEAITLLEQVVADSEQLLGKNHSDTLVARGNLATSYRQAGRTDEAIEIEERVVAGFQRLHCNDHPDTLTGRCNLANSYLEVGRTDEAIALLEQVVADSERLLGENHPDTLTARANLANCYRRAGRTDEAIEIEERVVAGFQRLLGEDHPSTLTTRANLAASYRQAERTDEAIALLEQVAADSEELLGRNHPGTFTARRSLVTSYRQAERIDEAIALLEQVIADSEQLLGKNHPDTLTARANLAACYRQAEQTDEAIALQEQVVADFQQLLGENELSTLGVRTHLADFYLQAGRAEEAVALQQQVVADSERLLGENHPTTLTIRESLATSCLRAGRAEEAVALQQQVVTGRNQLLGKNHLGTPTALVARAELATFYQQAGRTNEAIELHQEVVTDLERLQGASHPDTVTARANLATSFWQAGRTNEAIEIEEHVVTDRKRLLGEDHPDLVTARANLAASYRQAGRADEAVELQQQVVTDLERLQGKDHPSTLVARAALATSYQQAGRTEEAIELQQQVVTDSERILDENHPNNRIAHNVQSILRAVNDDLGQRPS